ncbi:MAG: type II secretion system protein [Candidatus Omnitrophota bacterium]
MRLKSNKAFSLIEVLITVGILSGAIIYIFRAFTASLDSSRFSQHISLGCYFAEDTLWQIEQANRFNNTLPLIGEQKIQDKDFKYSYEIIDTAKAALKDLKLKVSWKENLRENDYSFECLTNLLTH